MPIPFVKNSLLKRLTFPTAAAVLWLGSAVRVQASTIMIDYSTVPGADGTLTYIDNPATTNPARDSFSADIVSPQYGDGTLFVPDDYTNYVTATGHGDVATFTFGSGAFSGSEDASIDFSNGTVVLTYTITSGTGGFADAMGTLTEYAQFTSLGDFSLGIPATAAITSAGGTLTVSPEPGTILTVTLGLLGAAYLRRRAARQGSILIRFSNTRRR